MELNKIVSTEKDSLKRLLALEISVKRFRSRLSLFLEKDFYRDWEPHLRLMTIPPKTLLKDVLSQFEPVARQKSCTLTMQCPDQSLPLMGDFVYLSECLGRLVQNAITYTPRGGQVQLLFRESSESHQFSVLDNGIGISKENLSRVFSPCFRADNAINKENEGLGLGLWIATRIAEAHKGKLVVESDLGQGSNFTLLLFKR
ncbi:hypothetical protein BVX98_07125 [bacterium F11]|nr:hypothetical protein BVX98_07125 [bacterium F11]